MKNFVVQQKVQPINFKTRTSYTQIPYQSKSKSSKIQNPGSTEWVQHHTSKLMQRTVGLVNTDICVSGPIVRPQSSPVLADSFVRALKIADNPTESEHTNYYDFWYNWINLDKENNNKTNDKATLKEPIVKLLGSGSDHAPFNFFANIPAINLRFKDDNKKYQGLGTYPMYHTGYETFFLMDNLIDPGFKIHKTCTQVRRKHGHKYVLWGITFGGNMLNLRGATLRTVCLKWIF